MKYQPTRDKDAYPYAKNYQHQKSELTLEEARERIGELERGMDALFDALEEEKEKTRLLINSVTLLIEVQNRK